MNSKLTVNIEQFIMVLKARVGTMKIMSIIDKSSSTKEKIEIQEFLILALENQIKIEKELSESFATEFAKSLG